MIAMRVDLIYTPWHINSIVFGCAPRRALKCLKRIPPPMFISRAILWISAVRQIFSHLPTYLPTCQNTIPSTGCMSDVNSIDMANQDFFRTLNVLVRYMILERKSHNISMYVVFPSWPEYFLNGTHLSICSSSSWLSLYFVFSSRKFSIPHNKRVNCPKI